MSFSQKLNFCWHSQDMYSSRNVRKRTLWYLHPTKTRISLRIRAIWLESSFSAWKKREKTWHPCLSKMPPVRILIRLHECISCSKSSLRAHVRRYVYFRFGSYSIKSLYNREQNTWISILNLSKVWAGVQHFLQECMCEDSDQTAHPFGVCTVSMKTLWILGHPKSVLRRLWSDCADVQADLCFRWALMQFCRKCCDPVRISTSSTFEPLKYRIQIYANSTFFSNFAMSFESFLFDKHILFNSSYLD